MHHPCLEILHRYASLIDHGELEALAELMTHCQILDPDGNVMATGREEISQMYRGLIRIYPDSGTPRTQHLISNFIVDEQSSDRLRSRAMFNVQQRKSNGNIETIIFGQYKNTFQRRDEVWLLTEHQMQPLGIGDMSEHLLIDLGL